MNLSEVTVFCLWELLCCIFEARASTLIRNNFFLIYFFYFQHQFFLLEIKNGFLHLIYDFGFSNGPKRFEDNVPERQINDARYHEVNYLLRLYSSCLKDLGDPSLVLSELSQVTVIYHQSKKVILLVDKSHVKTFDNPKTTLPFSDIYIGGAPSSLRKVR